MNFLIQKLIVDDFAYRKVHLRQLFLLKTSSLKTNLAEKLIVDGFSCSKDFS